MNNNDWVLLQDYIKKINVSQFDIVEKEKIMQKEVNSLIDLYYKNKRKIRLLIDNNCKSLGYLIDDSNNKKTKIKVYSDNSSLFSFNIICDYLLEFRENNDKMFILINNLNQNEQFIISKLLVHFFFEDITQNESSTKLNNFISLLISKEIEKSESMFYDEIIDEDSFLSKILIEFIYRHEVKVFFKYIFEDILKDLFLNIEHNFFLTMNINEINKFIEFNEKKQKNKRILKNIAFMEDNFQINKTFEINDFIIIKTNQEIEEYRNNINYLFQIQFYDLKFIRNLFKKEKNEIKKNILYKYLFRVSYFDKKISVDYYSGIKYALNIHNKNSSNLSIINVIKNYNYIKKFFEGFSNNMSKFSLNIPVIIKNTLKTIYFEIQKKFNKQSKYEIINFITYYFIKYLIIPLLKIPEKNEILCSKLNLKKRDHLSLDTIILIFDKISKCELFSNESNNFSYTIVNHIVYETTYKLNEFILNLILNDEQNLIFKNEYKLSENETYKTISLSKQELSIFFDKYEIINIKTDLYEQMISNRHLIIDNIDNDNFENIYIFIKRNYDKSREEMIKNKKIKDFIGQTNTNHIEEIKLCINHILNNIPNLNEKINELPFNKIFSILDSKINYNNEEYKNILISNSVPLFWYSDYIVKNMNNLPDEYKINNFNKLYNEILEEVNSNLKILNKRNLYYSNIISPEIASLKKIISITKHDLKEGKDLKFKMDIRLFIDKARIEVCLISNNEKENLLSGKIIKNNFEGPLFLYSINECPHPNNIVLLAKNLGINNNNLYNDTHCYYINDFISRILKFRKYIIDDIENNNSNKINANKVIEKYLINIENILNENNFFHFKNNRKLEEKKNLILKELNNYILTNISKNLDVTGIKNEDLEFKNICEKSLSITLKDLNIDEKQISKKQLEIAQIYIKKMDKERYYMNVLKYFLKAINIIVKMIEFNTGKTDSGVEDFLPIIVYLIIKTCPENMISNLQFAKYFITQKDSNSMFGYSLVNYETCINFLKNTCKMKFNNEKRKK